jgi:tetratricopeptide (TPR) repeat protein
MAWRDRGDIRRSHEVLAEALQLAREIGDRLEQAHILTRMGEALSRLGRDAEASEHLAQASKLAQSFGDRLLQSESACLLAEVYLQLGDLKAARTEARRALDLADKVGSPAAAGTAHRVLGAVLGKAGYSDEDRRAADEHMQKSIAILGEVGNELELGRTYQSYADLLSARGDADGAATFGERASEIIDRLGPRTIPPWET